MTFVEVLILVALLVGVAIGKWYENGRIGGTEHMRRQRDNARRAYERTRAERDQLLELDQPPALPVGHPARDVHLVYEHGHRGPVGGKVVELRRAP